MSVIFCTCLILSSHSPTRLWIISMASTDLIIAAVLVIKLRTFRTSFQRTKRYDSIQSSPSLSLTAAPQAIETHHLLLHTNGSYHFIPSTCRNDHLYPVPKDHVHAGYRFLHGSCLLYVLPFPFPFAHAQIRYSLYSPLQSQQQADGRSGRNQRVVWGAALET